GTVVVRCPEIGDAEAHLAGIDAEQMRWLWAPADRAAWVERTLAERHARIERWLDGARRDHESGPTWAFAVDLPGQSCGAFVEAQLANPTVPAGEATLSYSCHPDHRGRGHVARAVRLLIRFVAEHTGAPRAHILVDPENEASLRVARAVGAVMVGGPPV